MHPALLYDVIRSQAGSLQKALSELLMNSVDAGATRVEVKLDRTSFCVKDDGRGFVDRREIDEFFETFGTPHASGDAVFGRFRMGRGQAFAFARNRWRTSTFEMDVDVQARGLDYALTTGCEPVSGCTIHGDLYDRLEPSDLLVVERALADQCLYLPIPLVLNGRVLNRAPESERWMHTDSSAFIRVDDSRQLSVYNLGVLVCHYPASDFGTGGVVVSKRPLSVNFARNDILRGQCQEWRAIRSVLTRLAAEHCGRTKGEKKTEAWREFQARRVLTTDLSTSAQATELRTLPLFTDVAGKHLSLFNLSGSKLPIVVAPARKSLVADRLQQTRVALVIDPITFNRFGCTLPELLNALEALVASCDGDVARSLYWELRRLRDDFAQIRKMLGDYDALSAALQTDHHVLEPKGLPKDAAAALRAVESVAYLAALCLRRGAGFEVATRKVRAMASETADAFTDGRTTIFININLLRGVKGPNRGIAWASSMASLLIHEYTHEFSSGVGHGHDAAFFEAFHSGVSCDSFGGLVAALFTGWSKEMLALGKSTPTILRQMDGAARIDDSQEATRASSAFSPPPQLSVADQT